MKIAAQEFLIWRSGTQHFALELSCCREIVRDVALTKLPHAPAFVSGLVNLRGSVVAVFDLELLLGLKTHALHRESVSLIRLHSSGYPLAVIVDTVLDTLPIDSDLLEDVYANFSESESRFIRKIARIDSGLVLIPNVERIAEKIT